MDNREKDEVIADLSMFWEKIKERNNINRLGDIDRQRKLHYTLGGNCPEIYEWAGNSGAAAVGHTGKKPPDAAHTDKEDNNRIYSLDKIL